MTTISVNYGKMMAGSEALGSAWGRIEKLLGELETVVGGTAGMSSKALVAYQGVKAQWVAAAADRQATLQALGTCLDSARTQYQQVDNLMASQFGG